MTVIRLSDYACHSDIVNGCVKYNITNKNGNLIAVMNDRENAKDYTRQLQQDYDRIQVQIHPERYVKCPRGDCLHYDRQFGEEPCKTCTCNRKAQCMSRVFRYEPKHLPPQPEKKPAPQNREAGTVHSDSDAS